MNSQSVYVYPPTRSPPFVLVLSSSTTMPSYVHSTVSTLSPSKATVSEYTPQFLMCGTVLDDDDDDDEFMFAYSRSVPMAPPWLTTSMCGGEISSLSVTAACLCAISATACTILSSICCELSPPSGVPVLSACFCSCVKDAHVFPSTCEPMARSRSLASA